MTWLGILVIVTVLVALVAVSGVRPKGARPVQRTNLMAGARIALVILVAAIAWAVWRR